MKPYLALPRGFSGGPLVDMEERFIGINNTTLVRGSAVTIPLSAARGIVEAIHRRGRLPR